MRTTVKLKSDVRKLAGIVKSVPRNRISIGWIDTKDHWMNEGLPVASVAAYLYEESAWGWQGFANSWMFDRYNFKQITHALDKYMVKLGEIPFRAICKSVGKQLESDLARNILETDSPSNSPAWAEVKGFNDPLKYGSLTGRSPNLLSEISSNVGKI